MAIRPLSKTRFDAFCYARRPEASYFGEEVEWYADERENVLGVVIRDRTDNDWVFVVLGRDERGQFRGIENEVNLPTQAEARNKLIERMTQIEQSGESVFSQGDERGKRNELFELVVKPEKLHPIFKVLKETPHHYPARSIIREMFYHFIDPDKNYIEQFQTQGFDARIWELYLYAYLHEAGFAFDRSCPVPDFTCMMDGDTICIEAVTANPTQGDLTGEPEQDAKDLASEVKTDDYWDKAAIKLASPLYSKLNKKYWERSNIKDRPLIFAIQDFSERHSLLRSSTALSNYLYGLKCNWHHDQEGKLIITPEEIGSHKKGKKQIPSGYFSLPGSENISAVLFSNSGTIAKFNRMGYLAGFACPGAKIIRRGLCYNHDPNAAMPSRFAYEVGDPKYPESWGQGINMFHNPHAKLPLDPSMFGNVAHHRLYKGSMKSIIPQFDPFSSVTINIVPQDEKEKDQ